VTLSVKLTIDPGLTRAIRALQAPQLHQAFRKALLKSMSKTLTIARQEKIKRGGVVGKGSSKKNSPPLPHMLTSRSGDLRRSLGENDESSAVDYSQLPYAISGGTHYVYGRVHEFGGTFARRGGSATYPPRPFLGPALEDASKFFEKYWLDEFAKLGVGS